MRVYDFICAAAGILGSGIASLFGGWDTALVTLVWFMAIDYITGMLVAGVFHKSPKTPGGGLESRAGWKGLIRKGVTLLVVLVATRLDLLIGDQSFIRDAVVIAFIVNDAAETAFEEDDAVITERMLEDAVRRTAPSVGADDIRHYGELRKKIDKSAKEGARSRIGFIQD